MREARDVEGDEGPNGVSTVHLCDTGKRKGGYYPEGITDYMSIQDELKTERGA